MSAEDSSSSPTFPSTTALALALSSSGSSSRTRKSATLAFDIEGTGGLRHENQLISFGWSLNDPENPERGQVALYLGKRENESWRDLWKRNGFEMRCFDEFWAKNLDKLEPLQIPPDSGMRYDGYWRFFSTPEFTAQAYSPKKAPEEGDFVVIESKTYEENKRNIAEWEALKDCDDLYKHFSPVFYIRADTERNMACIIHELLLSLQERYRLTYLSDTLHYDASWVDSLLSHYRYPPLLHAQTGDMRYKFMCWGREVGSYVMGLCGSSDSTPEDKAELRRSKRYLEARVNNGYNPENAHFAVDDALKIGGVWDEAAKENERRLRVNKRVADCLRGSEDETPNWAITLQFLEDNLDAVCEIATSSAKRQRTRK